MGSTSTSLNEPMGYAYYALNDLSLSTTKHISHEKKKNTKQNEKENSKFLNIEKNLHSSSPIFYKSILFICTYGTIIVIKNL